MRANELSLSKYLWQKNFNGLKISFVDDHVKKLFNQLFLSANLTLQMHIKMCRIHIKCYTRIFDMLLFSNEYFAKNFNKFSNFLLHKT